MQKRDGEAGTNQVPSKPSRSNAMPEFRPSFWQIMQAVLGVLLLVLVVVDSILSLLRRAPIVGYTFSGIVLIAFLLSCLPVWCSKREGVGSRFCRARRR
jgi:cell division protein FtsW (lipid II flippase)